MSLKWKYHIPKKAQPKVHTRLYQGDWDVGM